MSHGSVVTPAVSDYTPLLWYSEVGPACYLIEVQRPVMIKVQSYRAVVGAVSVPGMPSFCVT